jgi:glycosyltransferase involved in cell wall biosynthesis
LHVMANSGWAWHLFAAPAIWIGRARKKPVVVNYRGGGAERFLQRQFILARPTLKRASSIAVPSSFLQEVFGKRGFSTHIVPNIIDLSRFPPRDTVNLDAHILVARNLEDLYDIPTAIRAFGRIRERFADARLTIAGSGSRRAALERLCVELGIADAVTFTGELDNERMGELYRSGALLLNPSLADNMPISLLEAMACGLPIVSTNVGGIPYMVRDEVTALLVPPKDPEAMARAALRVLSDATCARRLCAAAWTDVQQYTWQEVRKRLFQVYAEALGREQLAFSALEPRP